MTSTNLLDSPSALTDLLTSMQHQLQNNLTGTVATHEAIKILVKRIEELESRIKDLQALTARSNQDQLALSLGVQPGCEPRPFALKTDYPIAFESHDHIFPLGTQNDNTRYPRFVRKCEEIYGRKLDVVDFGCAGGGMVLEFFLAGHNAIGLEGSDCPKKNQLYQWRWMKDRLFTCDLTKPFELTTSKQTQAKFDIISAWEVLEHIKEEQLPQFFANIKKHLKPDGMFCASVATFECSDPETGAVWHVTVKPKEWWEDMVKQHGFTVVNNVFDTYDFPRGSGNGSMDWSAIANPDLGFHLVIKPIS